MSNGIFSPGDAREHVLFEDPDIQVLFTRELGSADSVAQARTRLTLTAESCDDFATHRVGDGSAIEEWVRFDLS